MKVTVYSRETIEHVIAEGRFHDNTAVISFYDPAVKRVDDILDMMRSRKNIRRIWSFMM